MMMFVAASVIQSASRISSASGSVARGGVTTISEQNLLSYSERLLEANGAQLLRSLPTPTGDPGPLQTQLQVRVDAWCRRNPDGQGAGRVQIYFTDHACGQLRPDAAALGTATLTTLPGGLVRATFPFVIVTPTSGRSALQGGTLTALYGAAPTSLYALLVPDDLQLNGRVQVKGDVQVDGHLSVQGQTGVSGLLSSSNCNVATPQCQGDMAVTVGAATMPVMTFTPFPANPGWADGPVSLGQPGETAGVVPGVQSGLTISASDLELGVMGDGSQYFKACTYGVVCLDFIADTQRHLYQGSARQLLSSNWTGVIKVTTPGTDTLTIHPQQAQGASIALPISIQATSPVVFTGDVTDAATLCTDDLCGTSTVQPMLSVAAPAIRTSEDVQRLHATLLTSAFTNGGNMTVFGSVQGRVVGSAPLLIQADERALRGLAAPGVGRLLPVWRQARVSLTTAN
ncbi:hypothetical protein [Deinococcus ruber]|uniref:hypothetical protein n=1 Tax=Deinococcus ruber TaxID=1848197 RepID=UPI0016636763|nr:hypothetical protein [Deinococcus ruber]